MYGCRPVGGEVLQLIHSLTLQNTSMTQQHVGHLKYRRHMNAAAHEQLTKQAWCREACVMTIFSAYGLGPHAGTVAHMVHEGSA